MCLLFSSANRSMRPTDSMFASSSWIAWGGMYISRGRSAPEDSGASAGRRTAPDWVIGTFEGIRVVEITQGMAGPMMTMILGDYGAEVIRVEPPGGDPMWSHPAYLLWNRGKKSVEVDFGTAEGQARLDGLLRDADVV